MRAGSVADFDWIKNRPGGLYLLRAGCGGLSALHFPDPTGGTDARRGQDRRSAAQLGDDAEQMQMYGRS